MGHAFQHTLMDALTRYHRMCGEDTLWQPGTDHAGIATQMVVERQLNAQGVRRTDLAREAFLERVWQWKAQSGGTISAQMRRLGDSVDWSRERFTLDPELSRAVTEVFVRLHDEGLIYRGKRLVNWDPVLLTALSDLEVQARGRGRPPVAPALSARRRHGLPRGRDHATGNHAGRHRGGGASAGRALPGTHRAAAAPAARRARHPDHRRCVRRPRLRLRLREDHPGARFQRLRDRPAPPAAAHQHLHAHARRSRTRCRSASADSTASRRASACSRSSRLPGLIEKIEKHKLVVPRGDRSGAILEPYLTDQWYVRIAPLAAPAIAAVEQGRTRFVPENWARTYFEWMRNIKDWCVSRQLWWGHRIPAWYDAGRPQLRRAHRSRGAQRAISSAPRLPCARTRTCSTPGSPPPCGRSPRSAGPSAAASSRASTRGACWSPASTSSSSGSRA